MSEFYARYIPPSHASPVATKRLNPSEPKRSTKKRKTEDSRGEQDVLSKYSVVKSAKENDLVKVHQKHQKAQHKNEVKQNHASPKSQSITDTSPEKAIKRAVSDGPNGTAEDGVIDQTKHSKVLSRFTKSREKATQQRSDHTEYRDNTSSTDIHPDRIKLQDLAPIPQPENLDAPKSAPSYSIVPEWIRTPIKVSDDTRKPLNHFGLHEELLENLRSQGKKHALPVQTAVLPLLVNKPLEARPDLCITAATGSGKTFAYLLPIINAIRGWHMLKLEAVIVVPTRALVKQVVQAIRSCSTGLDLRVGTAEGSKTLAEEQEQLVEEDWRYDPTEYKRLQETSVNWSSFSLPDLLEEAEHHDFLDNVGRVKTYRSEVNILVCTPGRLVEHLKSTKGFDLSDVGWFVVDEADRLLNESYHEWLGSVLPALKTQKATEKRDQLLRRFRMSVPERKVNKILLSATMTHDISQLLGLELKDPRLVVVEDRGSNTQSEDASNATNDVGYQLPAQLHESAIAFKDSENKPLYLVELLKKHIFIHNAGSEQKQSQRNSRNPTPDDETSSSGSSTSSHSSDTDSETSSSRSSSDDGSDDDDSQTPSSQDSQTSSTISSNSSTAEDESNKISTPASKKTTLPARPRHTQPRVLIFTRSTESAHRLSRLLTILQPRLKSMIDTFTRSSTTTDTNNKNLKSLARTRNKILASFASGQTRILISTDLAARGLDIANLEYVINYDVPASALTYVHRVGRTARAGESGQAWTLVEHKQGKWFWETIGGKGGQSRKNEIKRGDRVIKKVNVDVDMDQWGEKYEDALKKLGEDVRAR